MGRIVKLFTTIRNNWKKSTFGALALSFGLNYANNSYEKHQLMRKYCELASQYGDQPHPAVKPFRHITVILNPAANKRNSKALFEKHCAPLLYLAGLSVTVVQTEFAGQAKDLLETLSPNTDCIVIAGGDGTLSETVTGLLRRANEDRATAQKLPIGILPLGQTNSIANALFGNKEEVQALIDSTMAVVDGVIQPFDVIKVEPVEDGEENTAGKPIYSLAHVNWGSFRDAYARRDKYWYFWGLRKYASVLFSSAEASAWECSYTNPCTGCSTCYKSSPPPARRWWYSFMPRKPDTSIDYSKIQNENCGVFSPKDFSAVEFSISSSIVNKDAKVDKESGAPQLTLALGAPQLTWFGFVNEGWARLRGKNPEPVEEIPVQQVLLTPKQKTEEDWLSIDSEDFEVKPMKVTLLPRSVNLFTPKALGHSMA